MGDVAVPVHRICSEAGLSKARAREGPFSAPFVLGPQIIPLANRKVTDFSRVLRAV